MSDDLTQRLAELILEDQVFSANDLTASGAVTIDNEHAPNAANNGIGALFSQARVKGRIVAVGTEQSTAPHRKGGLIRTWRGTTTGRYWARTVLR